jgi:ATP-binding cassette subfamily F protein uup
VATAILAFEGDGRVVRYAGNWSTYVALRAEREQEKKAAASAPRPSAPPPAAPKSTKKGLTYGERIELEGLMPAISEAEALLVTLEVDANDPDLFAKRGHEVKDRMAAVEAQRAKVAALYARWEDLESRKV